MMLFKYDNRVVNLKQLNKDWHNIKDDEQAGKDE